MSENRPASLWHQLRIFVGVAGVSSWGWVVGAVLGTIALAGLDTLGVASMVPLMALFTGGDPSVGSTAIFVEIFHVTDVAFLTMVIAGFAALVFVLKSTITIPFRWWMLGKTTRIAADASTELMRRYVLSPFLVHRSRKLPEIYRNISDASLQSSGVLLAVVSVASDLFVLAAILGVLLITAPLVTLFTLFFFALLIGGTQRVLKKWLTSAGEQAADAWLRGWQFLLPSLDGFREARLTSSAGVFVQGYGEARREGAQASRKTTLLSEVPRYVLEVGFIVAIVCVAGILFATGTRDAALTTLGVFAAASLRALPTLNRVTTMVSVTRSSRVGLDIFIDAVHELDRHESHDERPKVGLSYDGDIELTSVAFRFPDAEQDVVRDISLVIPENSTMAFVGSSGAGKSTILDLILGLLSPTRGAITSGGRRIDDDLAMWYRGLGVVPQDVFLLNSTLAANVAFGVAEEDIDLALVADSLKAAEVLEFVESLPDGMQTIVGERGVRLSGGQKQRIGLARALYRKPRILVLDEATSALDNETEHQIARTLQRLSGQLTLVIVAHRLSTVRHADRLIFLDGGRIAAEGTFDEVRAENRRFARLVELGELN